MQKFRGVVGRRSELLRITLCELLTGLSSQASVLMERMLRKNSVVAPFLGGIHYQMQVKKRHC